VITKTLFLDTAVFLLMGSRHCRTKDSLSPLSLGGLTALITSVALLNILPTINTTCIFQLII